MLSHLKKYEILLASNSPRRRELLAGLDIDYRVTALPEVDESYPDTLSKRFPSTSRKKKQPPTAAL